MNRRSEALSYWQGLRAEYERYREVAKILPSNQLRVQEDMRRYLCIRFAGFLEQATYVILTGYLESKSGGPLLHFAKSWFERAPNLTVDAFTRLIGRFGDEHGVAFDHFLTKKRRDSLGDLLAIRNDVAHGKTFTGQRLQPDRYYELCEETYNWLVARFFADSVEVIDETGREVVSYERTP